jgi:hypothetical protein
MSLREAPDEQANQRATDALERALRRLKVQEKPDRAKED